MIWEAFVLVFVAELGDRTQFTTIFMATAPAQVFSFTGLLAGTLNGASFGRDIPRSGSGFGVNSGQFIIVLDVARFTPREQFEAEIDRHSTDLTHSQALPGAAPVRVPGHTRAHKKQTRLANGIDLSSALAQQLNALAQRFALQPF